MCACSVRRVGRGVACAVSGAWLCVALCAVLSVWVRVGGSVVPCVRGALCAWLCVCVAIAPGTRASLVPCVALCACLCVRVWLCGAFVSCVWLCALRVHGLRHTTTHTASVSACACVFRVVCRVLRVVCVVRVRVCCSSCVLCVVPCVFCCVCCALVGRFPL